jgi:hypothetical protein
MKLKQTVISANKLVDNIGKSMDVTYAFPYHNTSKAYFLWNMKQFRLTSLTQSVMVKRWLFCVGTRK